MSPPTLSARHLFSSVRLLLTDTNFGRAMTFISYSHAPRRPMLIVQLPLSIEGGPPVSQSLSLPYAASDYVRETRVMLKVSRRTAQ